MFPRVRGVRHIKDYKLEITFSDGIVAELDFRHRSWGAGVSLAIGERGVLREVTVDERAALWSGRTVSTSA